METNTFDNTDWRERRGTPAVAPTARQPSRHGLGAALVPTVDLDKEPTNE
jgi:hypothetical protein